MQCGCKGPISTGYKMEIGPISTFYNKYHIEGLLDENGQWQEDETQVVDIVVDYYSNLFQSSNPMKFSKILEAIQHKVSPTMNQNLTKDFNACEVLLALK